MLEFVYLPVMLKSTKISTVEMCSSLRLLCNILRSRWKSITKQFLDKHNKSIILSLTLSIYFSFFLLNCVSHNDNNNKKGKLKFLSHLSNYCFCSILLILLQQQQWSLKQGLLMEEMAARESLDQNCWSESNRKDKRRIRATGRNFRFFFSGSEQKFCNHRIWTSQLWCRKQQLCQLSHKHSPNYNTIFALTLQKLTLFHNQQHCSLHEVSL